MQPKAETNLETVLKERDNLIDRFSLALDTLNAKLSVYSLSEMPSDPRGTPENKDLPVASPLIHALDSGNKKFRVEVARLESIIERIVI